MASNAKIIGDLIAADSSVAIPGDGVILASDLADGSVTTAKLADANVTIGKIATTVPLGTKNIIINGDMRIDQRNAGASVTATTGNEYSIDRFQTVSSVSSKYTIQQSTTSPDDFVNSVVVTSSSAYSVGASEQFLLRQFVEGLNSAHLLWGTANAKTVTLSFWTRSSLTGTFGGAVFNSGGTRSYPFTYTISSADTWKQKTITIAGDTSGTWLTTNGVGLTISFGLGAGSTLSGTAGSWAGAYYGTATGATSVVGTSGATWYVTGVQLEVGDTATPFEHRPYDMELARCQRYYEQNYGTNNYEVKIQGATSGLTNSSFRVSKRANATTTVYSSVTQVAGTVNNGNGNVQTAISSVISGKESFWVVMSGTSSQIYTYYFKSSAEL